MSTEAASAPAPEHVSAPGTAHPHPQLQPQSPTAAHDGDLQQPADVIQCAKPAFLHSPPDSNNVAKSEGSDSELSDLDEDTFAPPQNVEPTVGPEAEPVGQTEPPVDEIGEVIPDHWSGTVPVFCPTMDQFKDFKKFMEKVDSYGMKSGIIKIIPPKEWKEKLPKLDELVKQIRVREPIAQEIMGSGGTYRQVNVLHGRSYNLPQWRKLCEQSEHQPPARRGERRNAAAEKPKAPRPRPAAAPKTAPAAKKRGSARARTRGGRKKAKQEAEAEEDEDRPMTPVSPKLKPEEETPVKTEVVTRSVEEEEEPPVVGRMGGRMGGVVRPAKSKAQTVSARRKNARREGSAAIDEEAFKEFDYEMDISDYTAERCEELERAYWKTLTYAPPLYGADMLGTLFAEDTEEWNLNKLPNLLDVIGTKVPGVNTAYLYLGMWKATFAWHLEDVDLYSINYLHFGAPKQWYSISQGDARRFEAAMKQTWPGDAKSCDQFLRHKGYLISPQHLKQHFNITVNKCLSYPGEFVVTYPYGYHSGYNLGYNCAEAVNFALDSWLPMGKIAKRCECAQAQDSVWVDVYEIERKLRGEETEYEETEEEDDEEDEDLEDASGLPSPPESHGIRFKAPSRKRKRDPKEKEGKKVKKVRIRIKTRVEPPCCLCPNDLANAELLETDDGRKAHRMCALYLPETYIDMVDGKEVVANVGAISKERLDLKCLYCRSKRGGCFQCSHKKCARAYHATCAAAAGVFVEEAEVPVFDEDGTEYKEQAFEFTCRFHRTKRDRKFDGAALEDDLTIENAARALTPGETCQMQYYKGDIFAGIVVENRADEHTVLLDILPTGDRVEVEWKWLLVPDPADYRLPKASANAIPLPPTRKAKEKLNAKRTDEQLPRKDDPFVDGGFQWAEFNTCKLDINKDQAKLDLTKDNTMWYFLGKGSSDAKPQYTESLALPRHNPRSNFLDTLPKPPKKVTEKQKPAPRPVAKPVSAQIMQQPFVNQFSTTMGAAPSPAAPPAGAPVRAPVQTPVPIPVPAQAQASASDTGAPAPPAISKTEKPYVYKPRKPVQPTWTGSPQGYTQQQFASRNSPLPSPLPQQPVYPNNSLQGQAGYFTPGAQQPVNRMPQPAAYNPGTPYANNATFTQQRFVPPTGAAGYTPQTSRSPPVSSPGMGYGAQNWQAPPPHQPYQQPPQYQKPAAKQQLAPRPEPQRSPYAPSPYGAQAPPYPHQPSYPAHATPQPAPSERQQSIYQKYPFFMINYNRNRDHYRSPYNPSGGFMNGYEGNFKAHMMNSPFSVVERYAQPSSGNYSSPAPPIAQTHAPVAAAPPAPAPLAEQQQAPQRQQNAGQTQFIHYTQSNPFSSGPTQSRPLQPLGPVLTSRPPSAPTQQPVTTNQPMIRPQMANPPTANAAPTFTPQRPIMPMQSPAAPQSAPSMAPAAPPPTVMSPPATAPAKPAPAKIQYKIPEKQTPIPLPPMYLAAAKKKTPATVAAPIITPVATPSRASEAAVTSIERPTSSSKSTSQSTPVPAPSPSRQPPAVQQQGSRIPQTPVPIPMARPMATQPAPAAVRPGSSSSTTLPMAPPLGGPVPQAQAIMPTPQQTFGSPPAASPPQVASPSSKQAPKAFRPVSMTPIPLPPMPGRAPRNLVLASPVLTSSASESPAPTAAALVLEGISADAEKDIKRSQWSKKAAKVAETTDEEMTGVGFPDVPRESMALVEQMMVNLRRASSQSAPDY
ncbi:JmjC domain-containing protein [Plectosphaerella plurivora]|uniref:[histone H3]-trimethyl-L-lysine(9) demethylase n=1 Tax=Plectosphaerella plurivora TaxID=936078 RepID=A0A9P8VMN5_9PEZI|nr:JmjC domain-containing protein [Plectosphaerella plurivora]